MSEANPIDNFAEPEEIVYPDDPSLDIASDPHHMVKIKNDEWFEILMALEQHHSVFYKVWQMGRPVFNEQLETAAVQFDECGDFIWFHFNPQFWKRLQFKDKLFVICHEALHVILNHGVRTKDAARMNRQATNIALDVVVNHLLVNKFGFARENIDSWQEYCWVDTVFKDKTPLPPDDEQFEYYYNLFEKRYSKGKGKGEKDKSKGEGDGEGGGGDGDMPSTVDDHSMMGDESGDWSKVIDALNEGLSEEEKETLKATVEKHFAKDPSEKLNQKAGSGTGGQWVFTNVKKPKPKKKWETVIKKWSKKYLIEKEKDEEQWTRIHRRLALIPSNLMLPSDQEIDESDKEKTKIKVWFFLDTSGSCWGLKDRFFTAALSLPTERFDVRLFCFDTTVQETTLESRKIYGGGGTSFSILEQTIQKEMNANNENYPEAVFVITDGYGDNIRPEKPEKWYWFITAGGTKSYIDKGCNFFNLNDYE